MLERLYNIAGRVGRQVGVGLLIVLMAMPAYLPIPTHAVAGAAASATSCLGANGGGVAAAAAGTAVFVGTNPVPVVPSIIGDNVKNCYLNAIAVTIRETLIRKVTASIVQWINSGFEGKPSFVENFQGLITETLDEAFGTFIANDENFKWLCSPWKANIKLALGLNYARSQKPQSSCKLSTIHQNFDNFRNNWDWSQFVQVTTGGQNPFSAYAQVSTNLTGELRKKVDEKTAEVNQGGGFLNYQKCQNNLPGGYSEVLPSKPGGFTTTVTSGSGGAPIGGFDQSARFVKVTKGGKTQYCQTVTPGSVINSQLQQVLGSDFERLALADEINEIIAALLNYMIQQVLGPTGLGGLTKGSNSFIDRYSKEAQDLSDEFALQTRGDLLKLFGNYKKAAAEFLNAKKQQLEILVETKLRLEEAYQCYDSKYSTWLDASGNVIDPEDLDDIDESGRQRATFYKTITVGSGDSATETYAYLAPSQSQSNADFWDELIIDIDEQIIQVEQEIAQVTAAQAEVSVLTDQVGAFDSDQAFFEFAVSSSTILADVADKLDKGGSSGGSEFTIGDPDNPESSVEILEDVSLETVLQVYAEAASNLEGFDAAQAAADLRLADEQRTSLTTGSSGSIAALQLCQSFDQIQQPTVVE